MTLTTQKPKISQWGVAEGKGTTLNPRKASEIQLTAEILGSRLEST